MEKEKIEILRIVKNIVKEETERYVGFPSIDRRLLLKYPKVIYEGKLKDFISDLVSHEFLIGNNENNSAVKITHKGVKYLTDHPGDL